MYDGINGLIFADLDSGTSLKEIVRVDLAAISFYTAATFKLTSYDAFFSIKKIMPAFDF